MEPKWKRIRRTKTAKQASMTSGCLSSAPPLAPGRRCIPAMWNKEKMSLSVRTTKNSKPRQAKTSKPHWRSFSPHPHDTNSITLSRHHVKWQWQAHYYSELLCSMHCKLALWRHWNLILYNVIEREVRSSLNIAVSLAPCPSRIQTKWYSQIQTQLSHRAKSLQAHAHEATEPNCTSPLVPGSSIQVLWNSTSNITNFAKCKSPGWIITKKPCDTSGKDQTSLSALSIGCTSKSFTR